MVVYRRSSSHWLKWTLFIIVFALGMTITFSDVEGIDVNQGKQATVKTDKQIPNEHPDNIDTPIPVDDPETPSSIPEPATILLVGLGLGTAYVLRRRQFRA